jgi:hypothetical protein
MYEGLLDRKLARAPASDAVFLLSASGTTESAVLLESELRNLEGEKLVKRLVEVTKKTKATLERLLENDPGDDKWPGFDELQPELRQLALSIRKLLRRDGVIRPAGLYVTSGETRRSHGAHYTPPTLTEPIVRRTLGPIVYRDYSCASGYRLGPSTMLSPRTAGNKGL